MSLVTVSGYSLILENHIQSVVIAKHLTYHQGVIVSVVRKLVLIPLVDWSLHQSLQEGQPQAVGGGKLGGQNGSKLVGIPRQNHLGTCEG